MARAPDVASLPLDDRFIVPFMEPSKYQMTAEGKMVPVWFARIESRTL